MGLLVEEFELKSLEEAAAAVPKHKNPFVDALIVVCLTPI